MLAAVILLFTFHISLKDIESHRISDTSNFILFLLLAINPHPVNLIRFTVAWLLLILLSTVTHLGGGDFKMLTILLLTQGDILLTASYGLQFSIATTITLLSCLVSRRNVEGSIPMGPAILAPFTFAYLAI